MKLESKLRKIREKNANKTKVSVTIVISSKIKQRQKLKGTKGIFHIGIIYQEDIPIIRLLYQLLDWLYQ